MRFRAHIDGVSFAAPGVEGISQLSARWEDAWTAEPWQPLPSGLSPRQAKRLSPAIRLALLLAEGIAEAVPADAAWVFASSVGEGETLDVILRALCEPDMMIQPVRFQNAVHNAASGQWSILRTVTGPVTSIAGYDQTVGAGLLKALMQMDREAVPIGLIAYDAPIPVPLDEKRPLGVPMGFGLALSPQAGPRDPCDPDRRGGAGGGIAARLAPRPGSVRDRQSHRRRGGVARGADRRADRRGWRCFCRAPRRHGAEADGEP